MTMASRLLGVAALLIAAAPVAAGAQSLDYGSTEGNSGSSAKDDGGSAGKDRPGGKRGSRPGVKISPYIEAAQIATAELSPGNDVLTYSRLSAGVDLDVGGRNNAASLSLRYERYFGWSKNAEDGDVVSGIARAYTTIVPGVQIDAGALATRSRIEGNGGSTPGGSSVGSDGTQIYSVYAGPTVGTHVGPVKVDANYRIGYTRVEDTDAFVTGPGATPVDVFDDSVVHNANVHVGVKPGEVLPVGIGAGASYYREDISNLDQRVEDFQARADVTIPVSGSLAFVGGVGYENVEISSRDALRDGLGFPVVGSDGRYVTDKSVPRQIAYDTSGFVWDAGVIWKPSRRTAFEAHVGKRYGSTSYYGSFAYTPNGRSSINVAVYDNIAGFGGQVNRALADLPVQFQATRNPLTGDLNGCVASLEGNNCLSGVLASVRSSTFRARGIVASYSVDFGRINAGLGGGYDRRKFIGAPGTILAAANGVVDENFWLAAYMNAKVSARGTVSTNLYANWFQTGTGFGGNSSSYGASTSYGHSITDHLSATAALGIDGVSRPNPLPDQWDASALVGVRYMF